MRVAVRAAAPDLEAPGALTGRDALRDAFVDQPFERAIKRDTIVGDVGIGERRANFVMRERVRSALQGFDDGDAGARDATAVRGNQLTGGERGEISRNSAGRSRGRHDRMATAKVLMQHCSI